MASRVSTDFIACCGCEGSLRIEDVLTDDVDNEENFLSKKMDGISEAQKERGIQFLHGLNDVTAESDEMITKKLEEVELKLEMIPNTHALDLARSISIDYVKKVRLMFLRTEDFDVEPAAERIVRFFEMKLKLFGEAKLVKDITWWDLTEDDRKGVEQGGLQLLPLLDRAGRAVLFRIAILSSVLSLEVQAKVIFFTVMKAVEEEEIQKRGIVMVMYNIGLDKFFPKAHASNNATYGALPVKLAGFHLCYDNDRLEKLYKLILSFVEVHSIVRFRPHYGTPMECMYALMTFGIIREVIPVTASGEFNMEFHKIWLKKVQAVPINCNEEEKDENLIMKIVIPGTMDIVLGRGSHAKNSLGHLRFRYLLDKHREHYDTLNKAGRSTVSRMVLGELKEAGVRFIKRNEQGEGYAEVSEKEGIAKITHGFRNLRKDVESSNARRVEENSKKKRSRSQVEEGKVVNGSRQ